MRGQDVLFSKGKNDWGTPEDLFKKLDNIFNFDIDVACSEKNKKCKIGITPEYDGLIQNWIDFFIEKKEKEDKLCKWNKKETHITAWMNPPYSDIKLWIAKAYLMQRDFQVSTVALLPARTDTKWFHDYIYPFLDDGIDIAFLKGRLKFVNSCETADLDAKVHCAPFPSMLVHFKAEKLDHSDLMTIKGFKLK